MSKQDETIRQIDKNLGGKSFSKNSKDTFEKAYIDKNNLLNLKNKGNDKPLVFTENDAKTLLSIITSMLKDNLISTSFISEKIGRFSIKRSKNKYKLKARRTIIYSHEDMNNLKILLQENFSPDQNIIIIAKGGDADPAKKAIRVIRSLYKYNCVLVNPEDYGFGTNKFSEYPLISIGGPVYNTVTNCFHKSTTYIYEKYHQHIGYVKTQKAWLIWGDIDSNGAVETFLNEYIDLLIKELNK